jgi:hypothetical protein
MGKSSQDIIENIEVIKTNEENKLNSFLDVNP